MKTKKLKIWRHPTPVNIPTVGAFIKYKQAWGYMRAGALFRVKESYEQMKVKKKEHYKKILTGINLTGSLELQPDQTTLKLAVLIGRGLGGYLKGASLIGRKVAEIAYFKNDRPILLATRGGSVGLEHYWLPQLRSTFVYGFLTAMGRNTYDQKNRAYMRKSDDLKYYYKRSRYASANLTCHPTENLMYGIEYVYEKLCTVDPKGNRSKHRLQAAVGFKL